MVPVADQWWRSWHGAPTDPKWRTIAKRAGVPTSLVVAVAWAALDRASANAAERGRTQGLDTETLADFLDCEEAEILAILDAMRAKGVLDGDRFTAWEKRQPKREDGSAERAKAWRQKKKLDADQQGGLDNQPEIPVSSSDTERTRTHANATEPKIRGEKIREEKKDLLAAQPSLTAAREPEASSAAPLSVSTPENDLADELQDILGARGPGWAWAGADVHRWIEHGATADMLRRMARAHVEAGKPPPAGPRYFDKRVSTLVADAHRPMPPPDAPSATVTPLRHDLMPAIMRGLSDAK